MSSSLRHSDAGQTLVEFAFASVLFFATVFGIMSYGIAVYRYDLVANLAQEGTRWASVRGSGHASPIAAASEADVRTYVQGQGAGLTLIVDVYTVNSSKTCTTTHVDPSTLAEGSGFCVKVTNLFTPFTTLIPNSTLTLQSSAQMVMVR